MSPMASLWKSFTDKLKIIYLTRVSMSYHISCNVCPSVCMPPFKGYDVGKIAACTLLLEGTAVVNNSMTELLHHSTVHVTVIGGVHTGTAFI